MSVELVYRSKNEALDKEIKAQLAKVEFDLGG